MGAYPMLLVLALVGAFTASSTTVQLEQSTLYPLRTAVLQNQQILQSLYAEVLNTVDAPCPYPYTRVLGECFYATKKLLSWHKAREHCLGMKGDLASPDHLHALVSHVNLSLGPFDIWVGARKQDDGAWRWLNNKLVGNKDWYDTLPEARPAADCLNIHVQVAVNQGPLANLACSQPLGFACKMNSNNN